MSEFTVKLVPLGKELRVQDGTPLTDVLHSFGVEFPCGGKGICGRCRVRVLEGVIPADPFHREKLRKLEPDLPGTGQGVWRLACLSKCTSDLVLEVGQFDTIIQADETPFEFEPARGLGIAFDLGTTTLVGQLLDLESGKIMAVETAMNPQKRYGSDLISRLEAFLAGHGPELTSMIRKVMGEMAVRLMKGRGRKPERIAIVGNTVMHHFFSGLDASPLASYPFDSPHLGMFSMKAIDLGWDLDCDRIDFYPSIGSFVGSDILAGILATGMHRKESMSVLVDLGTNGEIVVGNRDRLLCASTAAGPAFEGARISQGMQAVTGAISSIHPEESGWHCRVVGNTDARGICGSGLIDAVMILRRQGLIGEFGEILSGEDRIELTPGVKLTQRDIQEFQLAKAAVAAGIEILLAAAGIPAGAVEDVYIAGGFGNYINPEHVTGIGMLDFPVERIRKLGNTALMGSKMFLFESCKDPEKILSKCRHVNLEGDPRFQDIFIAHLELNNGRSG